MRKTLIQKALVEFSDAYLYFIVETICAVRCGIQCTANFFVAATVFPGGVSSSTPTASSISTQPYRDAA
jgi:hypothetical protein